MTGESPRSAPERDPRVLFAIERTFLAWTRTALALMGFGFIVARLGLLMRELSAAPHAATSDPAHGVTSPSILLGAALLLLGIVVEGFALHQHRHLVARFHRGEAIEALPWPLSTMLGIALVVIGLGLAIYIVRIA